MAPSDAPDSEGMPFLPETCDETELLSFQTHLKRNQSNIRWDLIIHILLLAINVLVGYLNIQQMTGIQLSTCSLAQCL